MGPKCLYGAYIIFILSWAWRRETQNFLGVNNDQHYVRFIGKLQVKRNSTCLEFTWVL